MDMTQTATMFRLLLATAVLALPAASALAAPVRIVDDNFNGAGETPGDDAAVAKDVAWSKVQSSSGALSIGASGVGGTKALKDGDSGNKYRGAVGQLSSTFVLSDVGDSIVLEADFKSNNAPALPGSGDADGYRVGLFAPSGTDTGYFIDIGVQKQDNTGFESLTLEEDAGGANLAGNDANSVVRDSIGSNPPVINDNNYRHFKLTLTKTAMGVQVDGDYENGAHTLSYHDTTSPVTSIDRIYFGTGNHSVDYWMDNVTVDVEDIPEPSTLALAAIGLLGLRRRRRR